MSPEKINLIKKNLELLGHHKKNKKIAKKILKIAFYFFVFFLLIVTSLSYNVIFSGGGIINQLSKLPIVSHIAEIISGTNKLAGERQDRINILLLGEGGVGHNGPNLTDTMMLISLKPSTGQVAMISIPRDLYVPIKNFGYNKINSANAFGESSNYPGGGSALAAQTVADLFNQPIHYWARLDFSGFVKIINEVGGVDIYVERSFVDPNYPTADDLTQTISFEKGWQHFDGETALKFSRSRYGSNNEGSDFARAHRQQKVIIALKDKILSFNTLLNPKKIYNIYNLISDNLQTNIAVKDITNFLKLSREIDLSHPLQKVLDSSPSGLLIESKTADGAFILLPRVGDNTELQLLAKNIFLLDEIKNEQINIIIENGTKTEGLARQISSEIAQLGFNIIFVGNAPQTDFEKTVIYDLGQTERPKIISILKKYLQANTASTLPISLSQAIGLNGNNLNNLKVDYVIILGENANYLK